ncbi:MAG: glycosyltransferase family 39 protein [Candidatus Melainabacteria bacterium]|nr:glycosyltransferase family 39 protein [Candidatus Melainabacteria bacterium]
MKENFLRILVILFLFFITLYFYKLGSIGLIDVDEPRYAETGREMLESGNYIVPYFNYEVRYDKPIFFYWLEVLSMKLFGINEFSARLPSVFMALLTVGMLIYFLKTFFSLTTALLAALILMSCFEYSALSRFSITDMTLASLISSSIFSFFLGYSQIINSHRFFKFQIREFSFWYILGFIFLALAVLTKGPVAILIVGLILIPFFWWIRKLEYFFKNPSFWIGFVLFLVLVFPWYIAVHVYTSGEFTKIFFGQHNFNRYTSIVSGHKGSIFYFVPVVLLGALPWTFFLFQSVNSIIKKGLKSLLSSIKDQVPWFCLWWFIIVFLFFSFSRTKLLTYVLPLFPALSVIIAFWFDEILVKKISSKGLMFGLGIFFLFCLVIFYICLFKLDILLPREIKDLKLDFQIIFFAFLLLVGVSMAWASSNKDVRGTIVILMSTMFLLYFGLITFLLPKTDKHSQLLLRSFAKSIPKDVEIATYEIVKPSLIFYAGRHINKFNSIEKIQEKLNEENKFAFVAKKKLLEGVTLNNSYLWGSDSRYVFYTNYPVKDI